MVLRGKKVEKIEKIMKKSKIFGFLKSIETWKFGQMEVRSGRKINFFCKIFTFLAWACTGRAPSTGEKTYAFSAGGPKKSKKIAKMAKKSKFFKFSKSIQKWKFGHMEVSFGRKIDFFAKFSLFFFEKSPSVIARAAHVSNFSFWLSEWVLLHLYTTVDVLYAILKLF